MPAMRIVLSPAKELILFRPTQLSTGDQQVNISLRIFFFFFFLPVPVIEPILLPRCRDVSSPAIWATKISAHFGDKIVAQMSRRLNGQICSHTPSALNAGAKRSWATCHMAMPQCCYLAKGAKRPSHTTNLLTSSNISVDWSIWSTRLIDTFVANVTDAIFSPKWWRNVPDLPPTPPVLYSQRPWTLSFKTLPQIWLIWKRPKFSDHNAKQIEDRNKQNKTTTDRKDQVHCSTDFDLRWLLRGTAFLTTLLIHGAGIHYRRMIILKCNWNC